MTCQTCHSSHVSPRNIILAVGERFELSRDATNTSARFQDECVKPCSANPLFYYGGECQYRADIPRASTECIDHLC